MTSRTCAHRRKKNKNIQEYIEMKQKQNLEQGNGGNGAKEMAERRRSLHNLWRQEARTSPGTCAAKRPPPRWRWTKSTIALGHRSLLEDLLTLSRDSQPTSLAPQEWRPCQPFQRPNKLLTAKQSSRRHSALQPQVCALSHGPTDCPPIYRSHLSKHGMRWTQNVFDIGASVPMDDQHSDVTHDLRGAALCR